LRSAGQFDFQCAGGRWAGAGSYEFQDERLSLTYKIVLENGEPLRRLPGLQVFEVSGPGNQITLLSLGNETLRWERRLRG
jgi:hypothetical protein